MPMKTCTKCGSEKSLAEFSKDRSKPDGMRSHCKACVIAYKKANIQKINNYHASYRESRREKAKNTTAAWREANPERNKAMLNKYYLENRDRLREAAANRNAAYPEKKRLLNRNRRAMLRGAAGKLSADLEVKLFTLQKGRCVCGCKQPLGDDYHLDHIMPLALGGSNTDDNMQLLRKLCNLQKHAKHPVDFMRSRGFLL